MFPVACPWSRCLVDPPIFWFPEYALGTLSSLLALSLHAQEVSVDPEDGTQLWKAWNCSRIYIMKHVTEFYCSEETRNKRYHNGAFSRATCKAKKEAIGHISFEEVQSSRPEAPTLRVGL
ncbi:hypothetical protein C8J56DRAFT_1024850 [Mycena floridula]|nr:hypothetical protein C8J56DRAFT_1024850 [Mycena floridula]